MVHVLLVEDDEIDQMAFIRMIREANLPYEYTITASIASAKMLLQAQHFEVVLLDYQVIDGTGLEILPFLAPETCAIVITGAGREEVAVEALRSGVEDYLIKDTERRYLSILPVTIENVLKKRELAALAQAASEEALRLKVINDFVATTAHDFRTPLATIILSNYLIQRYIGDIATHTHQDHLNVELIQLKAEHIQQKCHHIDHAESRLNKMIDNMLELVRVSNLTALPLAPDDINHYLEITAELYRPLTEEKGITFIFEPFAEVLLADLATEFNSLISHLLDNALFHTGRCGQISLRATPEHDRIMVTLTDNGQGMTPAVLANIHKSMYTGDPSRRSSSSGSGLGLAIAHRLTQLHHGNLHIESEPGQGTTVRLTIPRAKP